MVKRWWQGVLGPDQVCPLAHAHVNVCQACFRHWGKKKPPCPHQVYGPIGRKQGQGGRQKENNKARSLKDKVDGGTHNPTLDMRKEGTSKMPAEDKGRVF